MSTAGTTIKPRLPMPAGLGREFSITESEWRVLVETTFPLAKTPEAVAMAVAYCHSRNLDVFKKMVHIVTMWNSALKKEVETIWPGIAEIRTTASRTGAYAGIDAISFGALIKREFEGRVGGNNTDLLQKKVEFPESASATVYRIVKGERCPFTATVYWEETYASIGKSTVPNDMWEKRPRGQLAKCAEAAALRMAFPEELGSIYAAEEMEGRSIDGGEMKDITPPPKPPEPPEPDEPESSPKDDEFDGASVIARLQKDAAAASTIAELQEVRAGLTPHWAKLSTAERDAASKTLMGRKAELEPKKDEPPMFDLEAFATEFDRRAGELSDLDLLDALWGDMVEPAQEQGLFSETDKESAIAPIYERHRARIDDIFPMDRG